MFLGFLFVSLGLKLFRSCSLPQESPGPFFLLSSLVNIIRQSPQRTEETTELFIPSGKGSNLWRACKKSGLGDFRKCKPFSFLGCIGLSQDVSPKENVLL